MASTLLDAKDTNHLFELVDDNKIKQEEGAKTLGVTKLGALDIRLSETYAQKEMDRENRSVSAHELGPTGGLPHPNESQEPFVHHTEYNKNLMMQERALQRRS
ncbi:MAG: hypothetical protein E6767_19625 [Dysgonomonas sp.]|nr:hypothetical protein [Dysgonomonas sp.]